MINLDGIENLKYPLFLVRDLKIPYLVILDKDYFLPYINKELKPSRDGQGFPKYNYEYKTNCLINDLVPNVKSRHNLLESFKKNHSEALNILEKNHIVCMRYSLEIDLVASDKATELFYQELNIPPNERTKKNLLVERYNQIKRIENILRVLDKLDKRNLPNSYKRIIKIIPKYLESTHK